MTARPSGPTRLAKQLTLFDVWVISTGAMFSSGFFLLPGIATAQTGSSVVLAYFLSGLLVLPALLSKAELATAMPKAGGTYYYLDRTLGPLIGTIGGIGTWLTLVLKSAFALIGMGAYLGLFFDAPLKPVAVGFTTLFAIVNIVGVRGSTRAMRVLVVLVVTILAIFIGQGVIDAAGSAAELPRQPFLTNGVDGLLSTVGLVFVSYIGLTKVASLAEEVKNPDRNIPLGMTLALASVTTIYVAGTYVMVRLMGPTDLAASLTPVADTALRFTAWIPSSVWLVAIVIAAVAAFTSMANAGLLAASRYPLAMARDRLVPDLFAVIAPRLGTPVTAILWTSGVLVVFLLVLNVEQVAKLASAVQLAVFGMVNIAVIVMRESQIEAYDPGFRSPLYPWMQVLGIVVPLFLVAEMGWLPVLFTVGVFMLGIGWYQYYARARIAREGAIFHVFARLGRRRFAGLDRELRDLLKEKGLRAEDPFDEVVARARVIDLAHNGQLEHIVATAAELLDERLGTSAAELADAFTRGIKAGGTPVSHGAALLHTRLPGLETSEMVLVRCQASATADIGDEDLTRQFAEHPVHAIFFLVSGEGDPGRHLRILAQLASRIEDGAFIAEWLEGADEQELKETLLRDERYLALKLQAASSTEPLIGRALRDLTIPEGCLVALIRRYGVTIVPRGRTVLREGDRLTIIGDPTGLAAISERYGDGLPYSNRAPV